MSPAENDAVPDRDEEAALWCLDIADGLSAEQQAAFDRWYADPENEAAFQRAAGAWETVELIGGTPEIVQLRSDALDAYRRGTLDRGASDDVPRRASAGLRYLAMLGALTALAAALVLMVGWSNRTAVGDYRTAVGERRVAMLDDGSRLSLDADSAVETRFGAQRRSIELTRGRARFDVAHDPLRPFTVAVGDKMVVATGTAFSVERLGEDARIVLFEGHVAVLEKNGRRVPLAKGGGDAEAALRPGNALMLPAGGNGAATLARDTDGDAGWRRGQVAFDDLPLPLAVERMNRYLREPLVVGDGAAAQVRVSGSFDGDAPAGFLDALRQLDGVRAERRAGKVILTRD